MPDCSLLGEMAAFNVWRFMRTIFYKRATFVTHLPATHLYTASHNWLSLAGEGEWRIGYTKFSLRMLGELVDLKFNVEPGAAV